MVTVDFRSASSNQPAFRWAVSSGGHGNSTSLENEAVIIERVRDNIVKKEIVRGVLSD